MNKNLAYTKGKILLLMLLTTLLLVSLNKVDVAAASPATYIYVDPLEVSGVTSGNTFSVNISVAEAPETYLWEIFISWDPALLELVQVEEGDFLDRREWNPILGEWIPTYETTFLRSPISLAEASAEGEIQIMSSLKGDVPWASGDGWLCTLGFRVEAEGSCVLKLFDTRLWDYVLAGAPAYTWHSNLDGFFSNTLFHDIAVTSVTASLTGEIVSIDVDVTNEGNYTETSETFNVTVYADSEVFELTYDVPEPPHTLIKNTTVVGDEITVGTQTVTEGLAPGATTTLTFTWDTTKEVGGDYTISAEAKGDDDTRNNLFIGGTLTVAVHDIAITNVVPSPTEVTVGDNVTIDVTVKNEGHFNETFDVTVYYDDTSIDTETDIFLVSGNQTTLTFAWDTTDVAKGTYTISAEVPPVSGEVDPNIADNTYDDGTVKVSGKAAPDILLYAAVGIVIIIGAAVAIYFIWFRKPT